MTRDSSGHPRDAETAALPFAISDLKSDIDSSLTLRRRFHRPSGLAPGQSVLIVIDTPLDLLEVALNDATLEPTETRRFPVQHLLAEHNLLLIKLHVDPAAFENPASASALDVRLEID